MTEPQAGAESGHPHGRVSDELRVLAELLSERIQPWLERMAQAPEPDEREPRQNAGGGGAPCTSCPVCALIVALRGDRPELLIRLAEHASGLLVVARELLHRTAEQGAGHGAGQSSGQGGSGRGAGPGAEQAPSSPGGPRGEGGGSGRSGAARQVSVQHVSVRPAAAPGQGDAAGC